MKECSIKGCHNSGETKGLCHAHYLATRKEYQHQYYLRKKAEKEWVFVGDISLGTKPSEIEHAAIGLIANIEQAKSKQGQGQKRRKASSPNTHGIGL